LINRSPSTISRELRRNRDACGGYSARVAQQQMQARRQVCRPMQKLLPGSERFELVAHMLRERLSPEQIAGKLRSMNIPSLEMPTSVARRSTTRSMPCQSVSCVRS
jgi:IS30 family transposase